mmetsp:Transcript_22043/g.47837  ORF Transcript_22043/g.47837 Transcript_22043/m.47837 type:complete len:200 (+) Transcript_22043:2133-2732(+)
MILPRMKSRCLSTLMCIPVRTLPTSCSTLLSMWMDQMLAKSSMLLLCMIRRVMDCAARMAMGTIRSSLATLPMACSCWGMTNTSSRVVITSLCLRMERWPKMMQRYLPLLRQMQLPIHRRPSLLPIRQQFPLTNQRAAQRRLLLRFRGREEDLNSWMKSVHDGILRPLLLRESLTMLEVIKESMISMCEWVRVRLVEVH